MRTKRQTFNKIKKHLLEQGEPAVTESGHYLYHSKDGLKCAVGCLISEDDYERSFERFKEEHLIDHVGAKKLEKILNVKLTSETTDMLNDLQSVHDNVQPKNWKRSLTRIEKRYFPR